MSDGPVISNGRVGNHRTLSYLRRPPTTVGGWLISDGCTRSRRKYNIIFDGCQYSRRKCMSSPTVLELPSEITYFKVLTSAAQRRVNFQLLALSCVLLALSLRVVASQPSCQSARHGHRRAHVLAEAAAAPMRSSATTVALPRLWSPASAISPVRLPTPSVVRLLQLSPSAPTLLVSGVSSAARASADRFQNSSPTA